ncbi:M50 family metallopeptidase [Neolewinella lacunae]|uniref:M50 family metallopeptidase n=1 Tax=Neolewinella lacunae TaxID=1517758 RepID=A0A923PHG8_9BACT|nr:M50 family metallopeptidase [Neolewinella lacunae]MBC6994208.1 M50 family metallopeptidase [Neolewinella lacunae]MDN3634633.1 M50 family metallopeptidase [Neolewinella lacunae]
MDLHWTFLFVPVAILYFSWTPVQGFIWPMAGWFATLAGLLFSFVLVHELGHALVARWRGVAAERIVLFPLGGGAFLPDQPEKTLDEVLIYAAGPLANIALSLLALPFLLARPEGELLLRSYVNPFGNLLLTPTLTEQILGLTIAVNLILAAGNLLPAYPLDGGRILRALLQGPLGHRRATITVTVLGVVIGAGLAVAGYLLSDPLLVFGALFIMVVSSLEFRGGWQRRRLAAVPVAQVIRPATVLGHDRIYPSSTVGSVRALFARTSWPVLPVFDDWNELLGFVEANTLANEAKDNHSSIEAYFEAEFVGSLPEENLLAITEKIVGANVYGAAIYGPRGKLIGYIFTEDLLPLLDTLPKKVGRLFKTKWSAERKSGHR